MSVTIAFEPDEAEQLNSLAERNGQTLEAWLRDLALDRLANPNPEPSFAPLKAEEDVAKQRFLEAREQGEPPAVLEELEQVLLKARLRRKRKEAGMEVDPPPQPADWYEQRKRAEALMTQEEREAEDRLWAELEPLFMNSRLYLRSG